MHRGYELALAHGLLEPSRTGPDMGRLAAMSKAIAHQVDRSNAVIDMLLASSRMERIDTSEFVPCKLGLCVTEAVETYPFKGRDRDRVHVTQNGDHEFVGSETLMVYVLFNLLKNSLYAINVRGKGDIYITLDGPVLTFRDTGCGIPPKVIQRIFEPFYTTKKSQGAGIGLAFCQRAVRAFGGSIACTSQEGESTTFTLTFPRKARGLS
jgi:two-component system CAI-1 autoinducer sensor kinase/phosphatase CqsS